MGKYYTLLYVLLEAYRNIKNNLTSTIISITTIAISLAIFVLFLLIVLNVNALITKWGQQIQVVAYLKGGVKPKEIESLDKKISSIKEVDSVTYVSKEKALNTLKKELEGYKGILDGITKNPLPDSFEIKMKEPYRNPDGINKVIRQLKRTKKIEDIQFGQKWVEKFSGLLRFVELFTLIIGISLTIAILFIISNTTKLAWYAREGEIEIARLVGASSTYIKAPFFIEGVFQGFIGALTSIGILFMIRYILAINIPVTFAYILEIPVSFVSLSIGLLATGVLFGIIGSMVSVNKF